MERTKSVRVYCVQFCRLGEMSMRILEKPTKGKKQSALSAQHSARGRGGLKANCNVGMDQRFTKSCGYSRRKKHKVPPLLHCVEKPRDDATLERRILPRSFFIEKNVSLGEC